MVDGHSLDQAERIWVVSGQLQGVSIRIFCDHPKIRTSVEEFIEPMVGTDGDAPFDLLEFSLKLLRGEPECSVHPGPKALLHFVNVSCFQEDSWLTFQTRDGSVVRADVRGGRAWGDLCKGVLGGNRYVLVDLLLAPLMEMLKHRGFYGLHAAAVTKQGRGILFPGGAGSGKTTIALSLVRQGFQYLADDKVLLREDGNGIAALAFTRRFNISPDIGRLYTELGFLEGLGPLPLTDKRPFDISKVYRNTFVPCCQPKVIVHLERTPDFKSRVIPLNSTESLTRLLRQTILSLQRDTAMRQITLLGDLVQETESYLLYHGEDLYGAPERALQLLPR